MTSIPLVVKPRRFKISLWSLTDSLEPASELDEIVGFQAQYALNRIPTAVIVPAHGLELHTENPSKILVNLNAMIKQKAPVGICVELNPNADVPEFAKSSDLPNDEDDTFNEKWPFGERVFIFKGYVAGCSMQRTGTSVRTQVQLRHWLQDLTLLSMYSPRSHTSSGFSFAADMCNVGIDNPNRTLESWHMTDYDLVRSIFDDINQYATDASGRPTAKQRTLYDCAVYAIKAVIKTGLANMDNCLYGRVDQIYFDKQERALSRLLSCLEYTDKAREALKHEEIWTRVMQSIDNTGIESWVTATVWDKICGHYAQLYFYALAPTAGWCHVIPLPSCIADEDKIITLTSNELTSVSYTEPTAPMLGGVVLADESSPGENSYGKCPQFSPIIYPPQKPSKDKKGGLDLTNNPDDDRDLNIHIKRDESQGAVDVSGSTQLADTGGMPIAVVKLPSYLQTTTPRVPPLEMKEVEVTAVNELTVRDGMPEARESVSSSEEAVNLLAYDLVRLQFLSQVFAGRRLQITTGFRGDIVPGACVKIHIDPVMENNPAEAAVDLYGTVEYVMLSASAGDQMSTDIVLNNIRNSEEYKSAIYNPGVVPFYKDIFTGKDTTLYCPFE